MTSAYAGDVARAVAAHQHALPLGARAGVARVIEVSRGRARVDGAGAAGRKIDLGVRRLACAKQQGEETDEFFHGCR